MPHTNETRICDHCHQTYSLSNQIVATGGIPSEENLPTKKEFISELPQYQLCPMDLVVYYFDQVAVSMLPKG